MRRRQPPNRRARLRSERGVALIEFALVLPLLVAFLTGLVSTGLWLYFLHEANDISAEAVRRAAVDADPIAVVQREADQFDKSLEVCISPAAGFDDLTVGESVTVKVTVPVSIFGFSHDAVGSSTMRLERYLDPPTYAVGCSTITPP